MSQYLFILIESILLFILQVCFSDLDGNKWTFTFPDAIRVLKRSDVVIPCTFTAPSDHGEVHLIWFKYKGIGYPHIYNGQNPSEVIQEYRERTSLVDDGTNSCSLKITDVRKTGQYYPGISEDINSYHLNNLQMVKVHVSGCTEDSSCKDWRFTIPSFIDTVKGSCVEIPCTFTHPEHVKDFHFFWFFSKDLYSSSYEIFNNRTREYNGQTFVIGNTKQNCSLRINNVQESGYYYPGVNEDINSYKIQNKRTYILDLYSPPKPIIKVTGDMIENTIVTIVCSVNHSCASSPPSITWNKVGHKISWRHEDLSEGMWRMESAMRYTPSYTDDKSLLSCTVTHPNNRTSVQEMTLDIKYGPKNVSILVAVSDETEDDYVTLHCTSQANPPVTTYMWYKIGTSKISLSEHGPTITVLNVTSEKYSCSASNEIGTASCKFNFSDHSEKSYLPLIIGGLAGLVALILLLIIFCVLCRKKKQSSSLTTPIKNTTVQEEIPMEEPFYGNVPTQSHKDISDEQYTVSPNSLYNNYNDELEQDNIENQTKDNYQEHWDYVLYTSVELNPPTEVSRQPRTEETEYTVIVH